MPSLAQLMQLPSSSSLDWVDLVSRVLHILGQGAAREWDRAVGAAEVAAAHACERQDGDAHQAPQQQQPPEVAQGAPGQAGEAVAPGQVGVAKRAAAAVLRPAAEELVATHLLCCQLLEAALSALRRAAGGAPSGGGAGAALGAGGGMLDVLGQQRLLLLSSLGRWVRLVVYGGSGTAKVAVRRPVTR